MNRALTCCFHMTTEKLEFLHISPLAVLNYGIETFFFFQNYQYEIKGLHFTDFCCFAFFSVTILCKE